MDRERRKQAALILPKDAKPGDVVSNDGKLFVLQDDGNLAPLVVLNLADYIAKQMVWSQRAFGPGPRVGGITKHIEKELVEVRKDPTDVMEWVDIAILAFDGAWRAGHSVEDICLAFEAKQTKNILREWPDWRQFDQDTPIEHDRSKDAPATT